MATTPQLPTGPVGASPTILQTGIPSEDEQRLKHGQSFRSANPNVAADEQSAAAQQGFGDNMADSWNSTAIMAGVRSLQRNFGPVREAMNKDPVGKYFSELAPVAALLGYTADTFNTVPDYDKSKEAPNLVQDIPVDYWDEIMSHNSLADATRTKSAIQNTLKRQTRMGLQKGTGSTLAMLAGGFVDVDMPLTLASGGFLGAAKVAGMAYKAARLVGIGEKLGARVSGMITGAVGGMEATAVQGAYKSQVDPTVDVHTTLHAILLGAVTGGGFGMMMPGAFTAARNQMKDLNFKNAATNDYRNLDDNLDVRANDDAIDMTPDLEVEVPSKVEGEEPHVETMTPEQAWDYENKELPGPQPRKSVGAAVVHPAGNTLKTPLGVIAPDEDMIIRRASDALDRSGARQTLTNLEDTQWGKIMLGTWKKQDDHWAVAAGKAGITRAVNAMGNDVMDMYRSKSNVSNWIAMSIFENPSSFGRGIMSSSAASLDRMAEGRIASTMLRWEHVQSEWAKATGNTMNMLGKATGVHISDKGARALYREVMLNMNDKRLGRAMRSSANPHVMELVTMMGQHAEQSLMWLKGHEVNGQFPTAVKGTENLAIDHGYAPQRMNGGAYHDLVTKDRRITEEAAVEAMTEGYMRTGLPHDVAEKIAKANLGRAWRRDADVDTSLIDLLTEDGRGFLRERLIAQNMSEADADLIIQKLTGMNAMAGQPGFTKHRNDLDLDVPIRTLDGSDLRLIDLMETDIPNLLHSYRKGVSGAGALARKNIRSRKERDLIFSAMQREQMALGEPMMHTDKIKAMFSDFDSGPQHGYSAGTANKGIDPYMSLAKRAANLSLLNTLGIPQLMETSNMMVAHGLGNFMEHSRAMLGISRELNRVDSELLEDLTPLMGSIGMDHQLFRQHTNMDELNMHDTADWLKGVNKFMGNASYIQSYTSMFVGVMKKQQEITAALLANKVIKAIKAGEHTERMKYDLGITDDIWQHIRNNIDNGTIEFATVRGKEYVNRINAHRWSDQRAATDFGAMMVSAMGNVIQRNAAGEVDMWARTTFGSAVSHLKTFPLTAIPKQMMRNSRFGFDHQTVGMLGYGLATAYLGLQIRDKMTGKDRGAIERAKDAIGYTSMTGWIPMAWDPTMTMLGLDDYRLQRFGRHYEVSIPMADVASRLMRVPGAVGKFATGEMNGDDRSALLAIPFFRTMGIGEWIVGNKSSNQPAPKQAPKTGSILGDAFGTTDQADYMTAEDAKAVADKFRVK